MDSKKRLERWNKTQAEQQFKINFPAISNTRYVHGDLQKYIIFIYCFVFMSLDMYKSMFSEHYALMLCRNGTMHDFNLVFPL